MLPYDLIKRINMLGVNDGSWEEELERDRSFSRVCFLKMKQLWRVGVLQILLCCKLEPYLETMFYWTALQAVWRARAERFSHKTATQTLVVWEEFCSWYIHKQINEGKYFRSPQVQNLSIEFNKS